MAGDHSHVSSHPQGASDTQVRALQRSLWVLGVFLVVEVVGGWLSGSLALLSDAGHMLTDVLGLGMALAAILAARRVDAHATRTFGLYRLEILAALANAVLLFGVAVWILVEAVRRIAAPPEVLGTPMLVVAVVGLAANLVVLRWLRAAQGESLNLEGASLEVLADTLGSVGVVIAAVVVQLTGVAIVDPIVGVLIGLMVLPRTWQLGRKALRILIQAAPDHVDPEAILIDLTALEGVAAAHDLHVWTLTSGMDVATVHLALADGVDAAASHRVLDAAQQTLRDGHGLDHATIQLEPSDHDACDPEHGW